MGKTLSILFCLWAAVLTAPQANALVNEAGLAAQLQTNTVTQQNEAIDERVVKVNALLKKHKSPLAEYAEVFVKEADEHNLDWRLVASIAGLESTFGKRIPYNSYNAWGWGIPTGASSGIAFSNWEQGIATVSEGLERRYVQRGLDTPEKMGPVYAASPSWAVKVRYFMNQFESTQIVDNQLLAMNW